jgi:hypothetical protein
MAAASPPPPETFLDFIDFLFSPAPSNERSQLIHKVLSHSKFPENIFHPYFVQLHFLSCLCGIVLNGNTVLNGNFGKVRKEAVIIF